MTKPQAAVQALLTNHELTETQIVEELAGLGIKTSQPTINRVKKGRPVRWEVGAGLIRLQERFERRVPRRSDTRASA